MAKEKLDTKNLNDNLKRLAEITEWFDNQEEINVEEGLKKVKEAVGLIKVSKGRLKAIENEFEEIKKGVEEDKSFSSATEALAEVKKRTKFSSPSSAARVMEELDYGKGYEKYSKESFLPDKLKGKRYLSR